jgi:hypothetical protein
MKGSCREVDTWKLSGGWYMEAVGRVIHGKADTWKLSGELYMEAVGRVIKEV